MNWNQRILLVRAVAYSSLMLAIVGFAFGTNIQNYLLITVSFVAALVAFSVGLSANLIAELIFQWRASVVRVVSLTIFVLAIFGFGLGTNIQSTVLVTLSFILALGSIAIGLNANAVTRVLLRHRKRGVIGRG